MMDYAIHYVFTDTALKGNSLAVVFDADHLDDRAMAAIAGEFNLSETVFVLKPENPVHSAWIRIFTTTRELPFAGHPTVGSAVALAERKRDDLPVEGSDMIHVIEEAIGPVRCAAVLRRPARRWHCGIFQLDKVWHPVYTPVRSV